MEKRDKFSEQWSEAFEEAELAPDKSVWSGIRAEMANQSADEYKRSAFYFRWMAAASVTLLFGVLAASLYYNYSGEGSSEVDRTVIALNEDSNQAIDEQLQAENQDKQQVADALQQGEGVLSNGQVSNTALSEEDVANENAAMANSQETSSSLSPNVINNSIKESKKSLQVILAEKEETKETILQEKDKPLAFSKRPVSNTSLNGLELVDKVEYSALSDKPHHEVYLQPIPDLDDILFKKGKAGYRDLWAGLSFGGGNFDPNLSSERSSVAFASIDNMNTNGLSSSVANAQAVEQTPAFSYGLGLDLGKRVGSKLVLQGGLTYQKYASETISSFELQNVASNQSEAFLLSNDRALSADEVLNYTDTYRVSNEFEYLSVPVEMGYLIVDRKVGFLLSSGVSTDMFIKNKIRDDSNLREDVTVTNGSDSPYKAFNLNGLIGGELYYTFNGNYLIALEPSYKFSIDGITKSEANFLSKPQSLFIGFKFKYFLK